jgi:AraC-like DNA-binding protein
MGALKSGQVACSVFPFRRGQGFAEEDFTQHSSMTYHGSVPHGIRLVRPAPGLEEFVRYYGQRNGHIGDALVVHPAHARAAPLLEFIFGDAVIFAPLNGKSQRISPRSVLVGMQTHSRGVLHIRGSQDSFVILFQPAGLALLFALPAQEFTDQDFDAESVLGPTIARLQGQLADCRNLEERVSIINRFLLRRAVAAGSPDDVSTAANRILHVAGATRIPVIADCSGLSLRQFERRFVQRVGINPKLFARIARFEATLDRMARFPGSTWTEVAHRFGYYDHMHMVHEFAELTGETPTNTLRRLESIFQQQMTTIRSKCHSSANIGHPRFIL